jgi:hypothetical protein
MIEKKKRGALNRDEKSERLVFIVEVFTEILGGEATERILNYLKKHHDIDMEQIPDCMEEFYTGLRLLLGDEAVSLIQNAIEIRIRKETEH